MHTNRYVWHFQVHFYNNLKHKENSYSRSAVRRNDRAPSVRRECWRKGWIVDSSNCRTSSTIVSVCSEPSHLRIIFSIRRVYHLATSRYYGTSLLRRLQPCRPCVGHLNHTWTRPAIAEKKRLLLDIPIQSIHNLKISYSLFLNDRHHFPCPCTCISY